MVSRKSILLDRKACLAGRLAQLGSLQKGGTKARNSVFHSRICSVVRSVGRTGNISQSIRAIKAGWQRTGFCCCSLLGLIPHSRSVVAPLKLFLIMMCMDGQQFENEVRSLVRFVRVKKHRMSSFTDQDGSPVRRLRWLAACVCS